MKSRTAALIREKQNPSRPLAPHPHPHSHPHSQYSTTPHPSKKPHLQSCNVFNLFVQPATPEQTLLSKSASSFRHHPQYCLLEQQNYRLIQSNFNLLTRYSATIQMARSCLKEAIMLIQEYHYVAAIETIYALLDRLHKVESLELTDEPTLRQASSIVEEYRISEERLPLSIKAERPKRNLQTIEQVFEVTHSPAARPAKLRTHHPFVEMRENFDDPEHPELLTPQFPPSHRFRNANYSLQESRDLIFESEAEEQYSPHKQLTTEKAIRKNDHQLSLRVPAGSRTYHPEDCNSDIVGAPIRKAKPESLYRKFGQERALEKNEDLYRIILMQASVIEYEALEQGTF